MSSEPTAQSEPTARVVSVQSGPARSYTWNREDTAIDKRPLTGPVRVGPLGIEGDEVGDKRDHGGTYQAVYAFAREDLDVWSERLGVPLSPGLFGENLTTSGIDVNQALVGERWRIGSVLLEVVSVRIPCATFASWLHEHGVDTAGWVRRFTAEARPGPYLRVVEPGTLRAGDALSRESLPDHDVTVSTMFRALTIERDLAARLLQPGVAEAIDPAVRERVARR